MNVIVTALVFLLLATAALAIPRPSRTLRVIAGTSVALGKYKAECDQARIAALNIILDRAYGKAAQLIQGNIDYKIAGPSFDPDALTAICDALDAPERLRHITHAAGFRCC
jgi:hypothetical protein